MQRVFYFPLRPKMRALLKVKKYHEMCQHEFTRPKNPNLMTDIYDGDMWKQFMGPCTYPNDRIGLLSCGDGIPAFAAGTHSLKPWMHKNMSLPPGVRSKIKYMLLWMLLQENIKPKGQAKYFKFAVDYELYDLHHKGIDGVKVKCLTITMDTKGKEEVSGKHVILFVIYIAQLITAKCACQCNNLFMFVWQECKLVRLTKVVRSVHMRGHLHSAVELLPMGIADSCRWVILGVHKR